MVARLAVAAGTAPPSTVALISLLGAVGGWVTVMILDGTAPMQPRPLAPQPSDRDERSPAGRSRHRLDHDDQACEGVIGQDVAAMPVCLPAPDGFVSSDRQN